MNGVLLDPRSGRPVDQGSHYRNYLAGDPEGLIAAAIADGRLPGSVGENLERARLHPRGSGPTATKQGFYELLAVDLADGAQIAATTVETVICPDYTFAGYDPHVYPGASFDIQCYFDVSNVVTTPGNITIRIRWGGVAGTILAQTSAIAMDTTARANFTGTLNARITFRTVGSAGSAFSIGEVTLNNVPAGAAGAPQGFYTMGSAGANVPAVVSSLDTTTSKALSVTAQFSVSTAGTQLTNHLRYLASLN